MLLPRPLRLCVQNPEPGPLDVLMARRCEGGLTAQHVGSEPGRVPYVVCQQSGLEATTAIVWMHADVRKIGDILMQKGDCDGSGLRVDLD